MKKILLFFLSLLCFFASCQGQTLRYTTLAKSNAISIKPLQYGGFVADTTPIIFNLNDSIISFGNERYEIFDRPKKWVVRTRYKFVTFQCTNDRYEKVMIRYFEYDNGIKKLNVLGETHAFRTYIKKGGTY